MQIVVMDVTGKKKQVSTTGKLASELLSVNRSLFDVG